jgi:DNA-binding CsgD family transcriptional regulator
MAGATGTATRDTTRHPAEAAPALRAVSGPSTNASARAAHPRRSRSDRLSRKERLVLGELALGNSTEEIGVALGVSPHTVRTHVKNLMRKLGARTRAHAVAIALSEHAIELRS